MAAISILTLYFLYTSFQSVLASSAEKGVNEIYSFLGNNPPEGNKTNGFKGKSEHEKKDDNSLPAIKGLKQIVSYQSIWKQIDVDGNGKKDYWTLDVCGFRYLKTSSGKEVLFMKKEAADADAAPKIKSFEPKPESGYFYKAIPLDSNNELYNQNGGYPQYKGKCLNENKYAFCAFPAEYKKTGHFTYIVNEKGKIYKKDLKGEPVHKWPSEMPQTKGWDSIEKETSYEKFDWKSSRLTIKKKAEAGDIVSQYHYGVSLIEGENQGVSLLEGKNQLEEGLFWLRKSAKNGYVRSQYELGYMYYVGKGVERSYKTAFPYMKDAANQDAKENTVEFFTIGKAQYYIGRMYYMGHGIDRNYEKSFSFYKKCADKRSIREAFFMVGYMYLKGKGVNKDLEKGKFWMKFAMNTGHKKAKEVWEKYFSDGVNTDEKE